MRSRSLLTLAAVAVAIALPASASSATSHPVRVSAPLLHCTTGLEASQRTLTVHPQMRPISGTVRMGIHLALYQRTPQTKAFVHLRGADGFDTWRKSEKHVGEYDLYQTLDTLAAPASYRMRVGFRWYGKNGHVLRTVSRLTRKCVEPDLRPNLVIKRITGTPPKVAGRPWHYAVVVRNGGHTAAGPFAISFAGGGVPAAAPLSQSVAGLAPGAQTLLTFKGPECSAATPPSALADSLSQVSETSETDNRRVAVC